MLFDLTAPGRKRTVQVIYLTLAILMGGGLVMFGIGNSDAGGGLIDAFNGGDSGGSGDSRLEDRAKAAQKRVDANPQNAAAWAELARARYQLAGLGDNFDRNKGTFTSKGQTELRKVEVAWDRYLALEPKKPDANVASLMVQAFSEGGVNKPEKAVGAQEIVVDSRPTANGFVQLAFLAYQANQTRKGDLAAQRAIDLTPKAQRKDLRTQIDQIKAAGAAELSTSTTGG